MTDAPDFSGIAESYSAARPGYPPELFAWLASVAPGHDLAWDCATGNGQAALGLAEHFRRVIATDRSQAQLLHARAHPGVEYRVGRVEASDLPAGSADLVVAAAAVHWFDRTSFYREVRRVARKGGVLAAWTYHVAHVDPPFDAVLGPFYRDVVGPYFAAGARHVDDRYERIGLPGDKLAAPAFVTSARWTAAQVLRFVKTWSGVETYVRQTGKDPLPALAAALDEVAGPADSVHELRWPIYLVASRL